MEDLNNVPSSGTYGAAINEVNANFSLIVNAINSLEYATTKSKGIYNNGFTPSTTTLPNSVNGDWCMVLGTGNTFPARIWTFNGTTWAQGGQWNPDGINLNDYATTSALNTAVANSLLQATARMGYGEATASNNAYSVSIANYTLPVNGGVVRVKMPTAATGAATLDISSTGAKTIWYNGLAVSSGNTWEAGEIISVFYDGTKYMSSNFQGGGGNLKVDDNDGLSDLDITDDNGFILAQFLGGHVRTKNFDSRNIKTDVEVSDSSSESVDLEFSDNSGNSLAQFLEGHVRTKNFDSRKLVKAETTTYYENFLVDVDKGVEDNVGISNNLQDTRNILKDRCIINLPPNYSADGEPVRLIIASFGSQGRIQSSTTKAYWTMPLVDTMLAEGYAVMQVNGTPGETDGIPTYGSNGTPQFIRSVVKAYQYVMDKYNLRTDGVLLSGWSQGTLKSWQIAANLQRSIPIKAAALFGPAFTLWKGQYAYAPKATREWMCEQFGFVEKEANDYVLDIFSNLYSSGDIVTKPTTYSNAQTVPTDYEFAYILNNYETWLGYEPLCWGTSKDIIGEMFRYRSWVNTPNPNEALCFQDVSNIVPCPMKLFTGTADIYTTPKVVNWYKTMAENGGMECHFRWYQGGDHSYPTSYQTINVQTKYGGTITTNVPSWEGMLFLERYD